MSMRIKLDLNGMGSVEIYGLDINLNHFAINYGAFDDLLHLFNGKKKRGFSFDFSRQYSINNYKIILFILSYIFLFNISIKQGWMKVLLYPI